MGSHGHMGLSYGHMGLYGHMGSHGHNAVQPRGHNDVQPRGHNAVQPRGHNALNGMLLLQDDPTDPSRELSLEPSVESDKRSEKGNPTNSRHKVSIKPNPPQPQPYNLQPNPNPTPNPTSPRHKTSTDLATAHLMGGADQTVPWPGKPTMPLSLRMWRADGGALRCDEGLKKTRAVFKPIEKEETASDIL